jgi:hypothetical protein
MPPPLRSRVTAHAELTYNISVEVRRIHRTKRNVIAQKEKGPARAGPFRNISSLVLGHHRAFADRGFANGSAGSNAQHRENCSRCHKKLLHEVPPVNRHDEPTELVNHSLVQKSHIAQLLRGKGGEIRSGAAPGRAIGAFSYRAPARTL